MIIRPLANDDEARIGAQYMAGTDPWLTLGRTVEQCFNVLSDKTCETYVAADGDELLGFIIINMRGAFVGYIRTVIVGPNARSRGVGSALVAFVEERIFRETPNAFLCVSSFNPRARALYERLGYEVVGTLRDYFARGIDEILMRKSIAPFMEFQAR